MLVKLHPDVLRLVAADGRLFIGAHWRESPDDRPAWMTERWLRAVPSSMLPKDVRRALGGKHRRRSTLVEQLELLNDKVPAVPDPVARPDASAAPPESVVVDAASSTESPPPELRTRRRADCRLVVQAGPRSRPQDGPHAFERACGESGASARLGRRGGQRNLPVVSRMGGQPHSKLGGLTSIVRQRGGGGGAGLCQWAASDRPSGEAVQVARLPGPLGRAQPLVQVGRRTKSY
jgi:hypothetical protein